jgi:hypothetical protein
MQPDADGFYLCLACGAFVHRNDVRLTSAGNALCARHGAYADAVADVNAARRAARRRFAVETTYSGMRVALSLDAWPLWLSDDAVERALQTWRPSSRFMVHRYSDEAWRDAVARADGQHETAPYHA